MASYNYAEVPGAEEIELQDFSSSSAVKHESPFVEESLKLVEATVPLTDNPLLPTLTFRFWILSILFTVVVAFINQFFSFRNTPLSIGILVIQLLSFPLGKFLAHVLPERNISFGYWEFCLNPGPFNIKEHILICVCANAASGTAYAIDIIAIQRIFYGYNMGFWGSFLLIMSTQNIGYGLAGLVRRVLVEPAAMIWPGNMANITLFRSLHDDYKDEEADAGAAGSSWRFTRLQFLTIVSISSFSYHLLPEYFWTSLSCISLLCLIAPNSRIWNIIGSGSRGLGFLAISLDWNTIVAYLGSPFLTPFSAQVNVFIGFMLMTWVLVPLGYWSNTWSAQTFPVYSSQLFTVNGSHYNPMTLLDRQSESINQTAYEIMGPLRLSYFFAMSYGIGFAALSTVVTHTLLHHGQDIWDQIFHPSLPKTDIHLKLMSHYEGVPMSWYWAIFLVNLAIGIYICDHYTIRLPWWALLLAVLLAVIFVFPVGIMAAITNQAPGLNIITEFIIGYLLPGRPIANVTFKTYGFISMLQALNFISDLKLGHYMKIPPKHMFVAQVFGTVLAGTVNLLTANMLFALIPNLCKPEEKEWGCASINVFYAASVIWGVIGPKNMFGPGSIYHPLVYFFLLGFLAPVPFWLLAKKYPNSLWTRVHIPVLLGSTAFMPPAQPVMYTSWFILGYLGCNYLARKQSSWWQNYGYVLSAGLDLGVALLGLFVFLLRQQDLEIDWWGNNSDCPTFAVI